MVAIDIDGTLGDYHSHLLNFAEGYLGHSLKRNWDGIGNWEDYLDLNHRTYRDIKLAFRQGGMKRTMPVFEWASSLCAGIQRLGAELWITTTRPYNRLDSVDPDTQEWLQRNNIWYDHLLYDDDKYQRLAELVDVERVCFVLDDLPEQCAIAYEQLPFATVVLREGCHNLYAPIKRIQGLQDARMVAQESIRKWYNTHG